MKVHYINIFLFSLPLNILVHNQRNHKKAILRTTKTKQIKPHRSLCECDLYSPSKYENDPEMKEVMEIFDRQRSERFREYDERMHDKRQKCKEQCEKDIQKIILKDKIGKQIAEQFSSLENNINTNDIPTCVCKKSMADRTEKFCLKYGYEIGGSMLQSFGLLGGIGEVALNAWKSGALAAAEKVAIAEGAAKGAVAGNARGVEIVLWGLKQFGVEDLCPELLKSIGTEIPYYDIANIAKDIITKKNEICGLTQSAANEAMCRTININFKLIRNGNQPFYETTTGIEKGITEVVKKAKGTADIIAADVSSETSSKIITKQTALIEAGFDSSTTSIYASIIVILIIVLIMVIIYLILRYRRKKKMKKKLLYIKLLEE
ncbi:PIR protein, putative [Plasmodium sp. gorilla clade G1]|nr:PIR protein, putative [Plasmodium sp. gorilla clade G1]